MNLLQTENVPVTGATATGTQSGPIVSDRAGATLVDKVILYNFFVKTLTNSDELVKRGFLHYENGKNNCPVGDDNIYKIEIHDTDENLPDKAPFRSFFYGISRAGHFYCMLELLVNRGDGTYNLFGNTPDELREQVRTCQEYLSAMGIETDFFEAKISLIEINRTMQMIESLKFNDPEFQSIGYRLLYDLPGTLRLNNNSIYKKHRTPPSDFKASSIGSTKEGLIVKLYDKTAELKKKYKLDTIIPYMRVENTISGSDKVKDAFGSNYLRDLTEKDIDKYYTDFMTKNVKDASNKMSLKIHAKLKIKIKKLFNEDAWHWAYNFILWLQDKETIGQNEVPLVMDPDEIYAVIDSFDRGKFKDRNRKRRMKDAIKKVISNPSLGLSIYKRSSDYWNEFIDLLCTPSEYNPAKVLSDDHDQSEQADKSEDADCKGTSDVTMDKIDDADASITKTMTIKESPDALSSHEDTERLDE